MHATFAFLANTEAHNLVRKLAWEAHQKIRTGTIISRLPPHISLKQPFSIGDVGSTEVYMSELARSIAPFEVHLTKLQLRSIPFQGTEYGLLLIEVEETEYLRQLHNRINHELEQRFENTEASFDGPEYYFHMTVAMGGQPFEVYQKFYNEITERSVNLRYIVKNLAMFVYDGPIGPRREYLTYKILPLGG